MVFVDDFGIRQGGPAGRRPEDGAEAAVDVVSFDEAFEDADDLGLVLEVHGGVGAIPHAENAEALELLGLDFDVVLRVLAAGFAELDDIGVDLFVFELLHHGLFDGEAVVVVAGDVGRSFAHHGLAFDDEVFEDLVEGRAEVDRSVGVRGAVVEHVGGGVFPNVLNELIDTNFVPMLLHFGLPLGQVGLHRDAELRIGEVEGVFQVHRKGRFYRAGVGLAGAALSWSGGNISMFVAGEEIYWFNLGRVGVRPTL